MSPTTSRPSHSSSGPRHLSRRPASFRIAGPILATAAVLALLGPLWFEHSQYDTGLAITALIYAAYGVGFNLIFGTTNQLFLCVGALGGIGAYTTTLLSNRQGVPMLAALILGGLAAAVVGGLLSWISVRRSLQVIFIGIITLVFSLALGDLLVGDQGLTGGDTGLVVNAAATGLADTQIGGYYLFAAVVVAFLVVFRALQLTRFGWAFRALRDNQTAAELAGVAVARYRIYAATIGSTMIGLTGALFAYSDGYISPSTFAFNQIDVTVLVLVAFGGLGSLLGPVIGATAFAFIDRALSGSGQLRELLYGAFVIALFLAFRRGVVRTITGLARPDRSSKRVHDPRPQRR